MAKCVYCGARGNGRVGTVMALLMVACAVTTVQSADDVNAINGYGKTTWGMTPDEVLKAEAPGAKRVGKPGELGDLRSAVAVDGIQIGRDRFNAEFYFDVNHRLQLVVVRCLDGGDARADARTFSSLEQFFTEKYGSPIREASGNSPRVFWKLPKTTIRLVHFNMLGTSRVNFSYEPSTASAPSR